MMNCRPDDKPYLNPRRLNQSEHVLYRYTFFYYSGRMGFERSHWFNRREGYRSTLLSVKRLQGSEGCGMGDMRDKIIHMSSCPIEFCSSPNEDIRRVYALTKRLSPGHLHIPPLLSTPFSLSTIFFCCCCYFVVQLDQGTKKSILGLLFLPPFLLDP